MQYGSLGYRQTSAEDIAEIFAESLQSRAEIIVTAYHTVLNRFDFHNPPNYLASQIINHAHRLYDSEVTTHRENIKNFQEQTHVTWPEPNIEYSVNAGRVALDGNLELLLKAPRPKLSAAVKTSAPAEKEDGRAIHRDYKVAILVAFFAVVSFGFREMFWRGKVADKDRRVAEQQSLNNELSPLLDSVATLNYGSFQEWAHMYDRIGDPPSVRNRLAHAFNHETVASYDSLVSDIRREIEFNATKPGNALAVHAEQLQAMLIAGIGK